MKKDQKKAEKALTKISRPRIDNAIIRKRLFRTLESGGNNSVIWVSGPGGAGKTTLLSTWLEARKRPCIWHQVDSADGDPATFFHYLGRAVHIAAPRTRRPFPVLTPEQLPILSVFSRRFFEDVGGRMKMPAALVFDNYQDAPPESRFHEIISSGIDALPAGMSVIILSRNRPPEQFARLRANQKLRMIEWDELRFTLEETRELARGGGQKGLKASRLEEIHVAAEGWAAGLMLLLEHAKRDHGQLRVHDAAPTSGIFDYFAAELFNTADPALKDFLLKTAFLPQITPGLARSLTKTEHAERTLQRFHQEHFFVTLHAGPETTYQYHQLFREFLTARARELWPEDEIRALLRRIAALAAEAGREEDAVECSLGAEDWDEAAARIRGSAPGLWKQGRLGALQTWIERLPPGRVTRDPSLLYWLGNSRIMENPEQGQDALETAFRLFRSAGDRTGMFLAWSDLIMQSLHTMAYRRMESWFGMLDEALQEDPSFPSRDIEDRIALNQFNARAVKYPYSPGLRNLRDRAFEIMLTRRELDINLRVMTGLYMIINALWAGEHLLATRIVSFLREAERSPELSDMTRSSLEARIALYHFFQNDHDSCLASMEKGLATSRRTGYGQWDTHIMLHGISSSLGAGDADTMERLLPQVEKRKETARPIDQGYYHMLSCWKGLLEERYDLAVRHGELSVHFLESVGLTAPLSACRLGQAEAYFELGRIGEANKVLEKVKADCLNMNSRLLMFGSLLLESRMRHREGDDADHAALRAAMALGSEGRYFSMPHWRPAVMAELCVRSLEEGIEPEYVRELVLRRRLSPLSPPLHLDSWPWPFKIFTLGKFAIERNDKPLSFTGKLQKKPLELLKALIAFGGLDVAEERLVDALWPDTDGDAARQSLATTVHRLRKLLTDDGAVLVQDGLVSLDHRRVWVDAWALMKLDCGMLKAELTGAAATTAERAMGLYKGQFLPGDTSAVWSLSMRERLKTNVSRLLLATGRVLAGSGNLERALTWFERGIEVDELAEEFYQELMECLMKLGRRAEAAALYQRCRTQLRAQLGINPSRKTEELYQELRKNV